MMGPEDVARKYVTKPEMVHALKLDILKYHNYHVEPAMERFFMYSKAILKVNPDADFKSIYEDWLELESN